MLPDQLVHKQEVARGVLLPAEDGSRHGAGGVVDGQQQGKPGTSFSQPAVVAAVNL